jgi:hypothetical protein
MPTWKFLIASQRYDTDVAKIASSYKTDEGYKRTKHEFSSGMTSWAGVSGGWFWAVPGVLGGGPVVGGAAVLALSSVVYFGGGGRNGLKELARYKDSAIQSKRNDFQTEIAKQLLPTLNAELEATESGRDFLNNFGMINGLYISLETKQLAGFSTEFAGRTFIFSISRNQTADILTSTIVGGDDKSKEIAAVISVDIGINEQKTPNSCTWHGAETAPAQPPFHGLQ